MAVIRVNKTANYTVISNAHFKEKEMSLKAKGLLSLMLSLPDDWNYSIAGLVTLSKDGKDSVMNALNELEKFGYLRRTKLFDENKRFAGYDYDIYEKPHTGTTAAEIPYSGKPNTENPRQLNNNVSSNNELNTDKSNNKNNIFAEFEILWQMYPRKIGKPKAFKAYEKARKNGATFDDVKQGIEAYCRQIEALKTNTEYIKHGSTWFNNEGWKDEYKTATRQASSFDVDDFFNAALRRSYSDKK